ncbi:TetR/AcrR family transcriptional regulator [SAR92 clade bacterium H921]|jgi:AcrR family transcriptional regulator|nr:TetR/AcrR family transcriptional regulator [SAR92 clade bacterium H921]MDG0970981.1 TetR/AcrR family transcriptional regulator [Porticoccaceae bacterium]MDG1307347.1 TetR/AcrR family transcriptional regulator [Porticoccaceae bacterium]
MNSTTTLKIVRPSYHHGDLRQALLMAAKALISEAGIENLSLRKLAGRAGVSRTAPYHHFSDKNDLLCSIAAEGFRRRYRQAQSTFNAPNLTAEQKFEEFICGYVRFAADNPEEYELMFGRNIWKQKNSTQELRDVAYPCFQHQLEMITSWQQAGLIGGDNPLRTSQVIWGAVHGIAKLLIDGIYTDAAQIEEVSLCAVRLFLNKPL